MNNPEQDKADELLKEAIMAARAAHVEEPVENGYMVSYVILYKMRFFNDEGDPLTSINRIVSDPAPSLDEQMGMHEYDMARLRKIVMSDDD